MADKILEVGLGFDPNSLESLKRSLKELQAYNAVSANANKAGGVGASPAAMEAHLKAREASVAKNLTAIENERKIQVQLTEEMKKQGQLIDNLQDKLKKSAKLRENELLTEQAKIKIKERELKLVEELNRAKAAHAYYGKRIEEGQGAIDKIESSLPKSSLPAPPGKQEEKMPEPGSFSKFFKGLVAAGSIATIVQAVHTATSMFRGGTEAPLNTIGYSGSAIGSTLGREYDALYSGKSAMEAAFAPQKSKAMQLALENDASRRSTTWLDVGATIGGSALAGGAVGSAGGLGGAVAGATVGLARGVGSVMGDDNSRTWLMSQIGGEKFEKEREAYLSQALAKDYLQAYQSQKEQDPRRTKAIEDFDRNHMRDLEFQRTMGLGFRSFHDVNSSKSFKYRANKEGFTNEIAMGMGSAIVGAGGHASTDNAILGSQLQRSFNLTNASKILGTLTSGMTSEASKETTIGLLAEGVSRGFDKSNYAEESRRFVQTAADLVSASGTRSEETSRYISDKFGSGIAEKSNAGIDAAKSSYELFKGLSGSTSGASGVMRAAGFLNNKNLMKLDNGDRASLASMTSDAYDVNSIEFQRYAEKAGFGSGVQGAQKLREALEDINKKSVFRDPKARELQDKLTGIKKGIGGGSLYESLQSGGSLSNNKEAKDAYGDFAAQVRRQFPGLPEAEYRSIIETASSGDNKAYEKKLKEVREKFGGKSDKIEDDYVAGNAGAQKVANENLVIFKDEILKGAKSAESLTRAFDELAKRISRVAPEDRTMDERELLRILNSNTSPKNQSQAE